MALIDDFEEIPRRKMVLFFMADTSGSMSGSKIGSVNDAIENVLPIISDISDNNPDAEINVAAMMFSSDVRWLYDEPKSCKDFIWQPVQASGWTAMGEACRELKKRLSRKAENGGFMPTSTGSGYYAPVIILLSDGEPTDDFAGGLKALQENSWFKHAIKFAIAIGNDADEEVLKAFTGSSESVIRVHNTEALRTMIRVVTVTSSTIGSSSTSSTGDTKQQQVEEQVQEALQNVQGASSAAQPDDDDDDWDD